MLDLKELEKLLAEATPEPWEVNGPTVNSESYDCHYIEAGSGEERVTVAETDEWRGPSKDGANAHAIVSLRNAAPALLALARAGRVLEYAYRMFGPSDFRTKAALAAFREADGG